MVFFKSETPWVNDLADLSSMLKNPPLSLYIHFPWCVKKCPYCDFNSHTLRTDLPETLYVNALLTDLNQQLPKVLGRPIRSIFMGGGTPSLFSPEVIEILLAGLRKVLVFSADIEITLEANPGTIELQRFAAYRSLGINRLSLGIQSFQDSFLRVLGRIHNGRSAVDAVHAAKAAGFTNINLDLMHGLPEQSLSEGLADLETAIALNPTHISWYQLTIEPNTDFAFRPPRLPEEDTIWELQEQGRLQLANNGYEQYEISAYSRPFFRCVHNCHYWQFADYLGIGAGAHSKLSDERQNIITRSWKWKHPKDYLEKRNNFVGGEWVVTPKELPFEFMLNALRLYDPLSMDLFESRTGLFRSVLTKPLAVAEKLELLGRNEDKLVLTDVGRRFYNDLVSLFLSEEAEELPDRELHQVCAEIVKKKKNVTC